MWFFVRPFLYTNMIVFYTISVIEAINKVYCFSLYLLNIHIIMACCCCFIVCVFYEKTYEGRSALSEMD